MAKVRVAGFSLSLDGFGAGPGQSLEHPLGERGKELHEWAFGTRTFRSMLGKDGGSDGRGVGFYFRNVTELILFGVRGRNARTLAPGRRQVNLLATRKREHSRKPDEQYELIEACSPGPYLELFARGARQGWVTWGDQASDDYEPTWDTYAHHSQAHKRPRKQGRGQPNKSETLLFD